MRVVQLDREKLKPAYNILCQTLFPAQDIAPPFGMTYCEIEIDGKTSPHEHYDGETFLILGGQGSMSINGEQKKVAPGDLICIPNHSIHELKNSSPTERLKFLSLYWDEPAVNRKLTGKYHIYSAPPTPNGKLHVGHLSGPYFAADVLRKYLKLRSLDVSYTSGADENQTYVPAKAKQLRKDTLQVMNEYTQSILETLENFNATPDYFLIPHQDSAYQKFVQDFFSTLVTKGALVEKEQDYPFCKTCQHFLHESMLSGKCPHCDLRTNGNGCESCGLFNDCRDLKDQRCNSCAAVPIFRKSCRYVFPLSQYAERLSSALQKHSFAPKFKKYVDQLLSQGLQEVTVSFPYTWGISVPNQPGFIIYEWLEMAAAFLYEAQKNRPTDWKDYWIDPANKTVLAFGFDNSFFYLAFVPALLWAFDDHIKYPDHFLINFFYHLDGKKFSTSRNHAIWGDEILEKHSADDVRLHLAQTRSEKKETNFSLKDFTENQGAKRWEVLLSKIEKLKQSPKKSTRTLLSFKERTDLEHWNLKIAQAELGYHPSTFSMIGVSHVIKDYGESLENYLSEAEETGFDLLGFRVGLAGVKGFAQILFPVAPVTAAKIFNMLGVEAKWSTRLDLPTLDVK